ncbi:MAG: hypothetical protein DDG59_07125 [Anaerolineae bacterium]|nr:MAG: hypothetical protein DDG59_07125 [Anaerolineae bacterium]
MVKRSNNVRSTACFIFLPICSPPTNQTSPLHRCVFGAVVKVPQSRSALQGNQNSNFTSFPTAKISEFLPIAKPFPNLHFCKVTATLQR